ncbi:DNA adenine methylase [Levilactobacillus brevis]|uniref:site-specific DNA-methyltransferase (adenine-specific) n=1 Tax=Levilactobacillus brevis ATCC 14869 = DSM 20054 TaxID=649758 RepID=U2P6K7_LEVBR|nr:DNA adenine methylase [Levilactobacillus brevis]ERK46135.1 D12 class N6 adenine-specific DNA methyltransferase [Levilactobacillus brevis ATCC 14869 = DSM 20054]KIO99088.1 DNA-methyltransferase [Levilactobacillus brevis]KRK20733.1 DNA methyltransferase [Levilactobacillus brevis ATCC 14869 = DSM 20054]MCT3570981.1 DNA adenine methylase [Levilactobacillus brevis]MCT3571891.1 DNA adenine methylase [Levilactobacillus brevis]
MEHNLSPLRYPGGKNNLYPYVKHLVEINNISTYVEPYAGGAAIPLKLLVNNDVDRIIINDIDSGIFNFWNAAFNNTAELIDLIERVPVNINEWYRQREIYRKASSSPLEKGFAAFFLNRTNRSGIITGGPIGGFEQKSKYLIDCRFNKHSLMKKIDRISKFSSRVTIHNLDAIDLIKKSISQTKNSLTFFDPPYFNKGYKLYRNFYTPVDHNLLSQSIIEKMEDKKWILTYDVDPYILNLYREFEHFQYGLNYTAGKHKQANEYLFLSHALSSSSVESFLKVE